VYSDTQLGCRGHACAKCGYCRDWYWRPDPNGQGLKIYTKRPNASCIYNHDGLGGLGGHYGHGHGFFNFGDCLCECEDNQS